MLKTDLHVHDPDVSWDSRSTRDRMLKACKFHGFDAIGFVGHDKMADVHDDDLTILNGIEHTIQIDPEVHIVSYPDQNLRFLAHPRRRTKVNIKDTAKWIMNKHNTNITEKYNGGKGQFTGDIDKVCLGNSDAHNPLQVNTSYTMVDSDDNPQSIADAVKNGKVEAHRGRRKPIAGIIRRIQAVINAQDGLNYVDSFLENNHMR